MKMNFEKSRYLSSLISKANLEISKILSTCMLLASSIFFIIQVILFKDHSIFNYIFSFCTILFSFVPFLLIKLNTKPSIFIIYIVTFMISAYFISNLLLLKDTTTTIWTSAFIILTASILYIEKKVLISVSIGILITLVFVLIKTPTESITITPFDHYGRIGVTLITIGIALYINSVYRKLIEENIDKINYECSLNKDLENDIKDLNFTKGKIITIAYNDELTKLPNKNSFIEELNSKIDSNSNFSIVYLDIDNFKYVNDIYGLEKGDQFLIKISSLILNIFNEVTFLARISGDKFAIILDIIDIHSLSKICNKILHIFDEDIVLDKISIHFFASIGIAYYPYENELASSTFKNAEIALYHSKKNGKNNFNFYNIEMQKTIERKALIKENLKKAIFNNEFELYFQPIIDIKNNILKGFEALLRWNSKEIGNVNPLEFIPIAEESGQIIEIGKWVFENALIKSQMIRQMSNKDFIISINISIIQMKNSDFYNSIKCTLLKVGIPAKYVELEIKESTFIKDFDETIKLIDEIKKLGVKIALDDFGTGYSSLSFLKKLPLNTLKIDKSFIYNDQSNNFEITKNIVDIGHKLQMEVVAEGVETQTQFEYLKKSNCDHIQGYYFEKPLKYDEILKFFMTLNIEEKSSLCKV